MKNKYSLIVGIVIMTSAIATTTNAHSKKISGFSIEDCHEDFEDVNFCSKKFVNQYKYALKNKQINFNHHYILHFLKPDKFGNKEVVAINPKNKRVITLGVEINPTSKVNFSKNSNTFCFSGSIEGYRQSNRGNHICYSLQKDKYSDFGVSFMNISYNR